jgi:hypothetical protein
MEEPFYFSKPELWYPYSEPRMTFVYQGTAGYKGYFADYSANNPNSSRLDRLILGS